MPIRYFQHIRNRSVQGAFITFLVLLLTRFFQEIQDIVIKTPVLGLKSEQGLFSRRDDDWFAHPLDKHHTESVRRKVENESAYFIENPNSVVKNYNFGVSQQHRRTLLRDECRYRAESSKPVTEYRQNISKGLQYILVVDCLRLIFCQVRKVSSVTWRMALEEASEKLECGSVRLLGSYSDIEKQKIIREYTKAIFVREPIERLVSAWNNKFAKGRFYEKLYGPVIVEKYRKPALPDNQRSKKNDTYLVRETAINKPTSLNKRDDSIFYNITFEEFISYIVDPDVSVASGADMHWQDVETRCAPCDIAYDFIGHFETKTIDAQALFMKLGTEVPSHFRKHHQSLTNNILRKELKTLPKYIIHKLYAKYKSDYRLFGYKQHIGLTKL
ncbi:carbohydrate sulfotransferase 14-like [Anneissia japonica]|uniref:carbohydrate sulfotransferase 14-like n=1 Tax=Anneissia japonica TaxID=1529436 RepID=UPI001425B54B|nr:carbohydrate sulfotransferase 14-like [Anneissia japonica]XP_033113998.1 carbohydrate sulfotransferase 14-like [Anneissia japonica]XP_033113999.1 carbohydrate sulfotransferase 14-like [Anneissia japonica]